MKYAFITTNSRYLTANGLHAIRQFSTHTRLNNHREEFDRLVSLAEVPQDQVKTTDEEGNKRPVLPHRQPKLVSNFSSSSSSSSASHEEVSKKEEKKMNIFALDALDKPQVCQQPAHSDLSPAEGVSGPSVSQVLLEEIFSETSSQSGVQSRSPENALITPVRESVTTDVVSPSTKGVGEASRPKEGKKRAVPRILRRHSPADRGLLRSELEAIAMKSKHGQRVGPRELDKYNKYRAAGGFQFLELRDNKELDKGSSHSCDDDDDNNDIKTRATSQSLDGKPKPYLETILAQPEQSRRVTSNISSSQISLENLKKCGLDLVGNDEQSQEGTLSPNPSTLTMFDLICDFVGTSGPLLGLVIKEINEKETGEKEGKEQTTTQPDLRPKYSHTRRRSPSSYLKKVEGMLEIDSISDILQGTSSIYSCVYYSVADGFLGFLEVKPPSEQLPIAHLKHNLERVLFK